MGAYQKITSRRTSREKENTFNTSMMIALLMIGCTSACEKMILRTIATRRRLPGGVRASRESEKQRLLNMTLSFNERSRVEKELDLFLKKNDDHKRKAEALGDSLPDLRKKEDTGSSACFALKGLWKPVLLFGGSGILIWQGIANNPVFFGFAAMLFVFGIYSCV